MGTRGRLGADRLIRAACYFIAGTVLLLYLIVAAGGLWPSPKVWQGLVALTLSCVGFVAAALTAQPELLARD